jgi:RecB family exonuclease
VNKVKLSATRINSFLQCKQRYWFSYVDRLEKLHNPVFALGLACHETLEKAGRLWQEKGLKKFSDKQIKELLSYYDEMSVREGVEDYEDHLTGKEIVAYRLNNFALGSKIVGIEDKFGFEGTQTLTTKDGVELIGAIDKAIEIDPNTLLIVDYKTSKTIPDGGKLKSDIQLSMYDLVARKLYPQYERIILSLDMLRTGEIVYTYRTDEEMEEFEKYLTVVHKEMASLKKEDAKPALNFLCAWCDHSNVCEKYQEMCKKKEFAFLDVNSLTDDSLMQEWEDVRASKKILEMREHEIASVILEKIKVQEKPVASKEMGKEMVLRQNARTTYNARKLSSIIPYEDFVDISSVSPTKLKKYMDKNPKVSPMLPEISETSFTSAFLATKKLKTKE